MMKQRLIYYKVVDPKTRLLFVVQTAIEYIWKCKSLKIEVGFE